MCSKNLVCSIVLVLCLLACSSKKEKSDPEVSISGIKWVDETTLLAEFSNGSEESLVYEIETGHMICYDEIAMETQDQQFQWYYFPEEYIVELQPGESKEMELFVVCGQRDLPRPPESGNFIISSEYSDNTISKEDFSNVVSSWQEEFPSDVFKDKRACLQWAVWAISGASFEELAFAERQLNDGLNSDFLLRSASEIHKILYSADYQLLADAWSEGMSRYSNMELIPQKSENYNILLKQQACEIDLDIYDGQGDRTAVGKANGEAKNLEETRGAYTVVNLNDTDGDNKVDNVDNNVTAGERDEVDLMKMVLNPPTVPAAGNVKLEITNDNTAIKLWKSSTKAAGEEQRREFPLNELPLTLWVEGLRASTAVRDTKIKLLYPNGNCEDVVLVTLIWADLPEAKHDKGDVLWAPMPNNLKTSLTNAGGTGLQPLGAAHAGNGIAFRSLLKPPGIQNETDVSFDFTRQMKRIRKFKSDGIDMGGKTDEWPSPNLTTHAIELPNDDRVDGDESGNRPNGEPAFYAMDAPGLASDASGAVTYTDYWYRANFCQFIRVGFNGRPTGNRVSGSRASPKLAWTNGHHFESHEVDGQSLWKRSTGDANESAENFIKLGHSSFTIAGF